MFVQFARSDVFCIRALRLFIGSLLGRLYNGGRNQTEVIQHVLFEREL